MRLAILIPMYNEDVKVVQNTINQIQEFFSNLRYVSYKIFIYDDGSTNNTAELLNKKYTSNKTVKIIKNNKNHGQGFALKQLALSAILEKQFDYFITFDADGQHRIQDAYNMCQLAENQNIDIVLGSRFVRSFNSIPFLRQLLIKSGSKLFKYIWKGIQFSDIQNGLRVFNRKSIHILTQIQLYRMEHSLEILGRIADNFDYLTVAEFPTQIVYTDYSLSNTKGESAIDGGNHLKRALKMVSNYLQWYFSNTKPVFIRKTEISTLQ